MKLVLMDVSSPHIRRARSRKWIKAANSQRRRAYHSARVTEDADRSHARLAADLKQASRVAARKALLSKKAYRRQVRRRRAFVVVGLGLIAIGVFGPLFAAKSGLIKSFGIFETTGLGATVVGFGAFLLTKATTQIAQDYKVFQQQADDLSQVSLAVQLAPLKD